MDKAVRKVMIVGDSEDCEEGHAWQRDSTRQCSLAHCFETATDNVDSTCICGRVKISRSSVQL